MLPPVSLPSAAYARPAASTAPEPPLDPPTVRSGACGCVTAAVRTPKAPGSLALTPTITAPARRSCRTTFASAAGR